MPSDLPQTGIRVIDVATWIAAPAAAVVLGDNGADIIKVERAGDGEPHRTNSNLANLPKAGTNFPWRLNARNKRSVALDVKFDGDRDTHSRLIMTADVLITNLSASVRARLELRYGDVHRLNSHLIHASFMDYGEKGPDKGQPGFESNAYFARAGIVEPGRYEGLPPAFNLPAQGDRASVTGFVSDILMALYHRERTDRGMKVASSLLANGWWSSGVMSQAALGNTYLNLCSPRYRPRSAIAIIRETRDCQWIQLSIVSEEKMWSAFCKAIERPEQENDPRFAEMDVRRKNAVALTAILDEVFRGKGWSEWREILVHYGITHASIARVADIPADCQAVAAMAVAVTVNPEVPQTLPSPFQIEGVSPRPAGAGPSLSADADAVLEKADLTSGEIAALTASGAAA